MNFESSELPTHDTTLSNTRRSKPQSTSVHAQHPTPHLLYSDRHGRYCDNAPTIFAVTTTATTRTTHAPRKTGRRTAENGHGHALHWRRPARNGSAAHARGVLSTLLRVPSPAHIILSAALLPTSVLPAPHRHVRKSGPDAAVCEQQH